MPKRQSIEIPGFSHANPIPGASRIGNIMMSSIINGRDPSTGQMPDGLAQQIVNVFAHIRSAVDAAGGTPENIIKVTFWVKDPATGRAALNGEWEKTFSEETSRPARHTLPLLGDGPAKVTCDFVAVFD